MPPGHHREAAAKREFTRRDRGFVVIGAGVLVALVVAIVIAIGSSSPKSGHGCVYVTIGSSTGALTIQGCGARARRVCADAQVPGAYTPQVRAQVIDECRKAGIA
jgi:hypothetical protein